MHPGDDDSEDRRAVGPSALSDRWMSQPSAFNGRDEPDVTATIALGASFALAIGSVVFVAALVLGGLLLASVSLLIAIGVIGLAFALQWLE
ncbi:hypothetical protein [Williamsia soli]|uniref:hypothetical protein n=1 Tax=Williamsia soli TaxID=364929 RepID=UPI001A9E4F93|nr:hypothetical protein [Williamsia soli]